MRIAAGILTIIGGFIGGSLLVSLLHELHIYGLLPYLPMIVAAVGGANALMRRHYYWALAGAICSISFPFFGIPAVIFLILRRDEFYAEEEEGEEGKEKKTFSFGKILLAFLILILLAGVSVYAYRELSPSWRGTNGEKIRENVYFEGGEEVGADGHDIELVNNPDAANPSWSQLVSFLRSDRTDKIPYNDNSFVCADFAETLHNNAERAGIRAAYVSISFGPIQYVRSENDYIFHQVGGLHACNAFQTADRGFVYIDDTGTEEGTLNADKTVNIVVGQQYTPVSIFPNPGYKDTWGSMDTVVAFSIQW